MPTKAGLPGWFPEDFKADPKLLTAFEDDAAWRPAGAGGQAGPSAITEQAAEPVLSLAAQAADVISEAPPDHGPVPDDPDAISMYTAHRVDDCRLHLSHASERLDAARKSGGTVRGYHMSHATHHLDDAHRSAHQLAGNLREYYPAEGAELDALMGAVGLAKAVSEDAKTATAAHLTQTICNHLAHTLRHVTAMAEDPAPKVWGFNWDHARTHLDGAVEHVGKLTAHLEDNYPAEAGFLRGLGEIKIGAEGGGKQKVSLAGTISGQVDLAGGWRDAWRHERRGAHGRWTADGDVMRYTGSLGVDRKDMPQVSGLLADGRYAPSSEMMPKFLDHLKAKGVTVTRERVPAGSLKPTQTTGDMRAVRGIADSLASGELKDTKPVLVSSDGRVVDGHHQWAAHILGASEGKRTGTAPGEPVIRADLPASKLMDEARQFAKDQGIQNRKTGVAANPKYARPSLAEQAAPADTLEKHTRPDGTLTPERAALHQQIIEDILAGHQPQEHPVATFFGGGPASGKSTALKAAQDSAHIDSDEIKARLPEYQQMLDAGDKRAASYVHEESSHISKQAMREARQRHVNYTLDSTGDGAIAKLAGKVNDARQAGYMTEGKYVTVGTDEAVRRAEARAKQTGRHVPEEYIRQQHAAVSDTYAKAAKMGLFDKTELWDTSGKAPALVAHKDPGGQFTVHDQAAWQAFTDKAKEQGG